MPDYAVISGIVDGKNDRGQRFIFPFCILGDSKRIIWIKISGTSSDLEVPDPWRSRAHLIDSMGMDDQSFGAYGAMQFRMFVQDSQIFQRALLQGNVKAFEYELIKFAADRLGLKAVVVARMDELSPDEAEDELRAFGSKGQQEVEARVRGEEQDHGFKPEVPHLVVLTCQPVLDPVGGIPLQGLKEGDEVLAALPEDSFFYDLFKSKLPGFDGVVSAKVISVKKTETGSTQVDLHLSDGLVGILRLSGNVRIKKAFQEVVEDVPPPPKAPSPMIIIAGGAVLAVLAGIVFYMFVR
ncbi:hypothetical protein TheveDRAFT_1442 [Thermanaerovibrio velox DSM 12556]|uniref:Uncharacterized protein n=1 Tax=Thermanaerovibrio velox DSM 12556 TaxID=926567 RepID=H0UPC9_9BACT|nr:hypothetical protein [Thermanaerovibrio velox]EHM10560.1 hypothetical protein TheveDRAFT_1442 [Thermanaerovibrio velox DSM 12556]